MGFGGQLTEVVILTTGALLWARRSNLDLGLRASALKGVWAWILLYVAWFALEQAIIVVRPAEIESEWLWNVGQLSLTEYVLLMVILGPIQEELLFRGALFSSLMRRWGPWVAIAIPSALWALTHLQYEPWQVASIAGSGVVLAIIRLKSGSLYVPLALHAGGNLLDMLIPYFPASQ